MKQSNTLYRIGVMTGFVAISAGIFTSGYLVAENRAKGEIKYLHGYKLDLPEEFTTIDSNKQVLNAYKDGDTIRIEFPETNSRFYDGQILLPDYVHLDTLIVTDGGILNRGISKTETDGEIAELLSITTKKY